MTNGEYLYNYLQAKLKEEGVSGLQVVVNPASLLDYYLEHQKEIDIEQIKADVNKIAVDNLQAQIDEAQSKLNNLQTISND